jgi:hypothetical protein
MSRAARVIAAVGLAVIASAGLAGGATSTVLADGGALAYPCTQGMTWDGTGCH